MLTELKTKKINATTKFQRMNVVLHPLVTASGELTETGEMLAEGVEGSGQDIVDLHDVSIPAREKCKSKDIFP